MAYEGPHPFPVPSGGTHNSSFSSFSVICGGTSSTATLQNVSGVGTSTQVLTSNGTGALPTWQNASGGGGVGTAQAWGYFTTDGSFNVSAVLASFNIASIVANFTLPRGYTVTFTTPFTNANYIIAASANVIASPYLVLAVNSTPISTTGFQLNITSSGVYTSATSSFACYFIS